MHAGMFFAQIFEKGEEIWIYSWFASGKTAGYLERF
jgi:hypothetical protein